MLRTPIAAALLFPALILLPAVGALGQEQGEPSAEERAEQQVIERFLSLLERSPRRGTALDRVYGHHVERGTLEEFVQSYRDRAAKDETDGTAWMVLGLLELERGRDAAAVEAFQRAEQHRPDDALASYYLGQALVLIGQPDRAVEAFERAIERKPRRTDLLDIFQALGRVHQRAQHNKEALAVWDRLEKLFPDDLRVQEQIAVTLAEEGQHAEAAKRYDALAKAIDDPYRQVTWRMAAADARVRLGQTDEALKQFEELLGQLKPDSWLYRDVRRNIEDVFRRTDDLAGLAAYYEGWLEKHPEDVEAMGRLGRTLALQGRTPEAQQWLEKAIKLAPSNGDLRLALIEQLLQDRKISAAVAQYEALHESDPTNPDTIRAWGRTILESESVPDEERKRRAVEVWKKLLAGREDDPVVITQVADLLRQAEFKDDALALYRRAVELAPGAAQYHEYLGEYLHVLERPDEAIAAWKKIADGSNRTVPNLVRLAEVLAGFGYRDQAIEAMQAAEQLDPKNFLNRVQHAKLLADVNRFDEALKQLGVAGEVAESDEEQQTILQEQIKNYLSSETLDDQITALEAELNQQTDAPAEKWYRLASLLEAGRRLPEAMAAIRRALELQPDAIPVTLKAAQIYETGGNLNDAVATYRKLATIDRRFRTEHLEKVATLELRLGRHEAALQAGRDLIEAAPGNPAHYQFYAQLCFQLGRADEGFEALRRAVRANPTDTAALLTLSNSLAEQFRTDEAIELFWQAFEKSEPLEDRLGIVARLTEMYLRTNHLDRLLERLERIGREERQERELALCLAQAYRSASDFGSARQTLESLLSEDTRDAQLLEQLSQLCEAEDDLESAARYQERLNEIAPSPQGESRLAQLYLRAGSIDEAEALWRQFAEKESETHRLLQAVDQLLAHDKSEAALDILERLIRSEPKNWEALYRSGVALAGLEKHDEAAERFEAVLALSLPDDEKSAAAKARDRMAGTKYTRSIRTSSPLRESPAVQTRFYAANSVRRASGLETRQYYSGSTPQSWGPGDYGQARIAALGWLYKFAQDDGREQAFLDERRPDEEATEPRALWDWLYVQSVREDRHGAYEAARRLPVQTDPEAAWLLLQTVGQRNAPPSQVAQSQNEESIPPLPQEELEQLLAAHETLQTQRPEWLQSYVLTRLLAELRRADQTRKADEIYQAAIESADDAAEIVQFLSIAASEGKSEDVLALFDRLESLRSTQSSFGTALPNSRTLSSLMRKQAEAKDWPPIVQLVDRYLLSLRRLKQESVAWQRHAARTQRPGQQRLYIMIPYQANSYRSEQIDYPTPNTFYDAGAIEMLRYAFYFYRQGDVLSDLFAHYSARTEKGDEEERLYARLALSYLHWWNGEKEDAVAQMEIALDSAADDINLTLELAELKRQLGENAEALQLVDSVEPLDQQAMEQREILALNLSVLTGNIQRARRAAERLFGLRLDSDLELQLAQQMHQLGMHEMAEAVLTRIRSKAGSQTTLLNNLMQQYQRQGNMETAMQIAHHILRKPLPQRPQSYGRTTEDIAREQALQLLARSGQLEKQIERLERQLEHSPNSIQLHRLLADYYSAAGQKEKAREAQNRLIELRPDNGSLRYELGQQMAQAGDFKAACDHYLAAIRQDPALLSRDYYRVQQAFQRAQRTDDLVQVFSEIDLKKIGQYYYVTNLIRDLMRQEKTRSSGFALFKRAWEAFPDQRQNLMGQLHDDAIWKLPELYDYVRQGLIPTPEQAERDPWAGIGNVMSYSGDGNATGLVTRLVKLADEQGKIDELTREVEAGLEKAPKWHGGRGLLAVLYSRRGRIEDAEAQLKQIVEKENIQITNNARWLIGQELEKFEPLQPLVLKLYEGGFNEAISEQHMEFSYSPARRLIILYRTMGQREKARSILLKVASTSPRNDQYNPGYGEYRYLRSLQTVASELSKLEYHMDAIRVLNAALADQQALDASQRWGGSIDTMLRRELDNTLKQLTPERFAQALKDLTQPPDSSDTGPSDRPAVDLVLLVQPTDLSKAEVTSLFQTGVVAIGEKQPQVLGDVGENVAELRERSPHDLSIQVARALVASQQDSKAFVDAATELLALVADTPLEELPDGAEPNARQRDAAARQLGLWLIAREAWKRDDAKQIGDRLADRALQAARRQADSIWTLAMLREFGLHALKNGDQAQAEKHWTEMLDMVLSTEPDGPPASDRKTGWIGTGRADALAGVNGARSFFLAAALGQVVMVEAADGPATVVTAERFQRALQIAHLAAEHGMFELSLRAVRESLAGGPPIRPLTINPQQSRIIRSSSNNDRQLDSLYREVEERLFQLSLLWKKKNAPADQVCDALAEVVLPAARTNEVFLYPRSLQQAGTAQARSVSGLLAEWAAKAGRTEAVLERLEPRLEQPTSAAAAEILRGQLGLAAGKHELLKSALENLRPALQGDTLRHTAELACQIALPALEVEQASASAVPIVEQIVQTLSQGEEEEPLASLCMALAQHHFRHNQPDKGRVQLEGYLAALEKMNVRYSGEYGLYRRKQQLNRAARELLRAGILERALEMLGEAADIQLDNRYGSSGEADVAPLLAQQLAARGADEQYQVLKEWTLPQENRNSIRVISTFVQETPPPAVFAQILGRDSFPAVADGIAPDIFSTATALVESARALGKLDELAAAVVPAVESNVEHAATIALLIDLARGKAAEAKSRLQARIDELKNGSQSENTNRSIDLSAVLIASAALEHAPLRQTGVEMVRELIRLSEQNQDARTRPHLRRLLARGMLENRPQVRRDILDDVDLAHWHPASHETAGLHASGTLPPMWVAHDGYITHIAGRHSDYLYFKYPLTGTFEFSADVWDGGWAEGNIGYGGIVTDLYAYNKTGGVFTAGQQSRIRKQFPYLRRPAFNRHKIEVRPDAIRFLVNGHLLHEQKNPTPANPWLALFCDHSRQTFYRNLQITGSPEIPREVRLVEGDSLLGWISNFYGESQPAELGEASMIHASGVVYQAGQAATADHDWTAEGGTIHGRRQPGSHAATQSRLYYHRPLREGDRLEYEFFYVPGEYEAHPAVGRTAFLLEPDGVRLHWMTTAHDEDWTGLPADNTVTIADERRGPDQLPLNPGEWNQLSLALDGDVLRLQLNGTEIYERQLAPENDRLFGFYRDKSRSAAQIRNVVLRGDWPERLTPEQLADLTAPAGTPLSAPDRRFLIDLIGEEPVRDNLLQLVEHAQRLGPEERYELLARFVLPTDDKHRFRLYGDFTPSRLVEASSEPTHIERGGRLVSPALLLVETAKELNRLDELYKQIDAVALGAPAERRSREAMLILISLAREHDGEALLRLQALHALLKQVPDSTPDHLRWPELLAASRALQFPALRPQAEALLNDMVDQTTRGQHSPIWVRQLRHHRGLARTLGHVEQTGRSWGDDPPLELWSSSSQSTAQTHAQGWPREHWDVIDGELVHVPGHGRAYMYLNVPLRGEFEVQCRLRAFGWRETYLAYGGFTVGLRYDLKSYEISRYGRHSPNGVIDPPMEPVGPYYDYRLVVSPGQSQHYVNGRLMHTQPLPPEADPWLAVYVNAFYDGGVRDLRIVGTPEIPERVELSSAPDLTGWVGEFYGESVVDQGDTANADWHKQGNEIVGRRVPELAGMSAESLLQYHRPLFEDGRLEYDFYYEPGQTHVHPALDRLAFLIDPEGVRTHWLTCAEFERTGLLPDTTTENPDHRRGPSRLPLKEKDWNQMQLTLAGDTLKLTLNDQPIYECPLHKDHQRTFGLFHYKDATAVRVRNVTWRGDWPKEFQRDALNFAAAK